MKKLYQGKGRRVHPAPSAAAVVLPAAVLALASALTAEEQEVLAYLLSCGGSAGGRPRRPRRGPHPPEMGCACFGCYKSFWARWDASPNRHLIHRIIDAVEEGGGGAAPRRPARRRRRGRRSSDADEEDASAVGEAEVGVEHQRHPDDCCDDDDDDAGGRGGAEYEGDGDDEEEEGASSMDGDDGSVDGDSDCNDAANAEKSTVGRLVRFIGEKVWGAWN